MWAWTKVSEPMTKITILGTANAIPDENHANTHMVIQSDDRMILIDCAGNPVVRLKKAGIDFNGISDLILTHFHPDHVSGVPSLLMCMWLTGRKSPLHIYALHSVIDRIEGVMEFYDWGDWPGFFPIVFYRLPDAPDMKLIDTEKITVSASPVQHLVPTIGLRLDFEDGSLAYSCDTSPCDAVIELARDVDLLIHEASGKFKGHSSALQAGQVAAQAHAKKLCLIHYPVSSKPSVLTADAQSAFSGNVLVAEDFMRLALG